jgi:hypothetical protein
MDGEEDEWLRAFGKYFIGEPRGFLPSARFEIGLLAEYGINKLMME